jgi:hypothetical protein
MAAWLGQPTTHILATAAVIVGVLVVNAACGRIALALREIRESVDDVDVAIDDLRESFEESATPVVVLPPPTWRTARRRRG